MAALAAYQQAIDHATRTIRTPTAIGLYTMVFHADYSADRICREHQHWNAVHAASLEPKIARFENDLTEPRRLRVGYIAATFRDHCQSFFIMPLLSHHDHEQVEVIAYNATCAALNLRYRSPSGCAAIAMVGDTSPD